MWVQDGTGIFSFGYWVVGTNCGPSPKRKKKKNKNINCGYGTVLEYFSSDTESWARISGLAPKETQIKKKINCGYGTVLEYFSPVTGSWHELSSPRDPDQGVPPINLVFRTVFKKREDEKTQTPGSF